MSNNSFTIYMKCGQDTLTGGETLYGLLFQISQDGEAGTTVDQSGELVSGNPPSWFHGLCAFTAASGGTTPLGFLLITDDSEDVPFHGGGVENSDKDHLSILIDDSGLGPNFIGNDGVVSFDSSGNFTGRYYADVDSGSSVLKDAVTSGATVKVKVTVTSAAMIAATEVEGSIVREPIQPMGFERGTQIYNDIIH